MVPMRLAWQICPATRRRIAGDRADPTEPKIGEFDPKSSSRTEFEDDDWFQGDRPMSRERNLQKGRSRQSAAVDVTNLLQKVPRIR